MEASVRSILITDAINTISVYGGLEGVKMGLLTMCEKMSGSTKSDDFEIARYVLHLVQLAKKLEANDAMAGNIADHVDQIKKQLTEETGAINEKLYANLAELYKQTISTMRPKIIVQGEHGFLSDARIVDKVRTVLLAGIRSAFLWIQLGGSRWQLVFGRQDQLAKAKLILSEL